MVTVLICIDCPGEDRNTITVDLLKREDARAAEWDMAYNIQEMLRGVMEMARDGLPPGEVNIEVIEPPEVMP
jgi:hypothetical protein